MQEYWRSGIAKVKNHNLFSAIAQRMSEGAEAPLLTTDSGASFNYRDANVASAKLAQRLAELGLVPGDRV